MKAPFRKDGSLMHYPERYWIFGEEGIYQPEWVEVEPAQMALRLEGIQRGRSAAYFMWVHEATGAKFPMFMKDVADMLLDGVTVLDRGRVSGTFAVRKRGQNYGIRKVK